MSSSNAVTIKNLLVIGAGTMGSGIALTAAMSGKLDLVVVNDRDASILEASRRKMEQDLSRIVKSFRKFC